MKELAQQKFPKAELRSAIPLQKQDGNKAGLLHPRHSIQLVGLEENPGYLNHLHISTWIRAKHLAQSHRTSTAPNGTDRDVMDGLLGVWGFGRIAALGQLWSMTIQVCTVQGGGGGTVPEVLRNCGSWDVVSGQHWW